VAVDGMEEDIQREKIKAGVHLWLSQCLLFSAQHKTMPSINIEHIVAISVEF
jgi:hypothetical protein